MKNECRILVGETKWTAGRWGYKNITFKWIPAKYVLRM
jgi:hypothetical protein